MMKIILIGDGAVGKTALKQQYLGEGYRSSYLMTVGADFANKNIEISGKGILKTQIWDLAGQPSYAETRSQYYSSSHGCLVVFDVTRRRSFDNVTNWLKELIRNVSWGAMPIVLVGNKIDLREEGKDAVSFDEGQRLAQHISAAYCEDAFEVPYIETSAKDEINVEKAFLSLAEVILEIFRS